ncbi:putative Phytocyanin domain, cupredoxin [Helianthus debilis subsp. tardiflorus]
MATFSHMVVVLAISVAVLLPTTTMATEYVVGGDSGWTTNFDYQNWAKDKQFYVGDKLVFKYQQGQHNVYKVNASAFASCTAPDPSSGLKSGNDVVTLMAPGKKWYICGVGRHCADLNQKLVINVQGWAPAPAPNSATKYGYQTFMAIVVVVLSIIAIY